MTDVNGKEKSILHKNIAIGNLAFIIQKSITLSLTLYLLKENVNRIA